MALESISNCKKLQVLNLNDATEITQEGLIAVLANCNDLCELYLAGAKNINDFSQLKFNDKLQVLDFSKTVISDNDLFQLNVTNLKSINLSQTRISDTGLLFIARQCVQLENLYLSDTEITGRPFAQFVCKDLKSLDVSNCNELEEQSLVTISRMFSHLEELNVCGNRCVTFNAASSIVNRCHQLKLLLIERTASLDLRSGQQLIDKFPNIVIKYS
eukprot:TRINITY_DN5233_c0_g1_i1.p1 TRINITY_DN5233_c0_g1~~TRINITY_DN5233_c0_g1_i1.p1  ORF type:complete len:216 (-),score=27.17 TRINITY_DN5233_c0_g1_i1:2-649(-)